MWPRWGRASCGVPDSSPIPDPFSTRGVDKSTYCDYQLIFLLHVHGLPLSAKRSLFILIVSGFPGAPCRVERPPGCPPVTLVRCPQVSTSMFLGLVLLYIIICLLLPLMVKACNILRWKINNMLTPESYGSHSSSSRVSSSTSESRSKVDSRVSIKVAENKAEPEEIMKKSVT